MRRFHQIALTDRNLISVSGSDRASFLQGLISNDIEKVGPTCAIWAALLTPQGKFLHDFFITEFKNSYYLDCEASRVTDLGKRLSRYKLRADVNLNIAKEFGVWVGFGEKLPSGLVLDNKSGVATTLNTGVIYCDPRTSDVGIRGMLPKICGGAIWSDLKVGEGHQNDYETLRISLGLPDGSRDMIIEKSTLLENNFDSLNGIDWDKGCYIGQELTARTKYRGLLKKRLFPVSISGTPPETGSRILADGYDVGEIRSVSGVLALALLRLEHLEKAILGETELRSNTAVLKPLNPKWLN